MSQPPVVVAVEGSPSAASAWGVEVAATADSPVEALPVAVVPPEAAAGRLQRVVVGIDGSAASARSLHWAPEHARRQGVGLTAVLARDLTPLPTPATAGRTWTLPPVGACEQQAHAVLDSTLDDALGAPAVTTVEPVVVGEQPAPRLLVVVRPDDPLVLADRGRGAP